MIPSRLEDMLADLDTPTLADLYVGCRAGPRTTTGETVARAFQDRVKRLHKFVDHLGLRYVYSRDQDDLIRFPVPNSKSRQPQRGRL